VIDSFLNKMPKNQTVEQFPGNNRRKSAGGEKGPQKELILVTTMSSVGRTVEDLRVSGGGKTLRVKKGSWVEEVTKIKEFTYKAERKTD